MPPAAITELTHYPETALQVGQQVREAVLDHSAFEQLIKPCQLSSCRATCCYDGVYLGAEEAQKLQRLTTSKAESGVWDAYGLTAADGAPLSGENALTHTPGGRVKTDTRSARPGELATHYPAHFQNTRCVFLDSAGRCGLQRLALADHRPPWFYKPITCWIHPIALAPPSPQSTRATLTLYHADDDPQRTPDYPGFCSHTPCGQVTPDGIPAREALTAELQYLSDCAQRDLLKELNSHSVPDASHAPSDKSES